MEHSPESLRKVAHSNELKRSLAGLDAALRTGALGPLVASLGLPAEAAMGVDAFLSAVQAKAEQEKGSSSSSSNAMETD